jgi:hypothetical protein
MMRNTITIVAVLIYSVTFGQSIQTFYNNCPCKMTGIPSENDDHTHYTVDEKNAYLAISYDDPDYSYEYSGDIAFTYFVKRDKQKVFAFSHFFDGPSSVSADYAFYSISNNQWVEASVLPDISIADFTNDSTVIDSLGLDYRIQLELPQQGTDVSVIIHPVGENDSPFEYGAYLAMIRSLPIKILKWNRDQGLFEFAKP